jgi:hypothetical protein
VGITLETAPGAAEHFDWLDERQRAALNDEWANLATCVVVDEFGLTRNRPGLRLVMAFILESMETRAVLLVVGSHGYPIPDRNM